jgi:hypothetical protein
MSPSGGYGFDLADQLTNGPGYSATYDAVGNRQTADGRTYSQNTAGLNQYGSITGNGSLSYDANGNLASWNGVTFSHDSQG